MPQEGKNTIIHVAPRQILIKGKATYRVREKIPVSSTTQPKPEKVRLSTEDASSVLGLFLSKRNGRTHQDPSRQGIRLSAI